MAKDLAKQYDPKDVEDRIYKYFDEVNADPVVYHWTYKLDEISSEDVL